jgi:histidyl-tRNA synthetase
MAIKPAIPKGTRDFLPEHVAKRNYIFNTIRKSFEKYGYRPIETPSFELSATLMGKYGDEGDRLIFRILNSGDKLLKADSNALENKELSKFSNSLSEKALRYDLTVPFARFVVQHQNELSFPFKRYQIQPVWRADRPQHGRYQEFYQCDADVVGSESLLYETEFVLLFDDVLSALQLPDFSIKINNRKILTGIAEVTGELNRIVDLTVALDKLDKIGEEGVVKELHEKGISKLAIEKMKPLFTLHGDNVEKMNLMKTFLSSSELGQKGIEELNYILNAISEIGLSRAKLEVDFTLARGLNYYTGAIFEVKANGVNMGSICGGGRYDNLTGTFGLKNMSGVGVSFGADRIYDVLNELNLFPAEAENLLQIMFVNFGQKEQQHCMKLVHQLRKKGVSCELYPTASKLHKQMKYANDLKVKYVALIGEEELKNNSIQLKNMETGEQNTVDFEGMLAMFKSC